VRLKSGGPMMGVVSVDGLAVDSEKAQRLVECVWTCGKEFLLGKFPAESLEPVPQSGPSSLLPPVS
jgi:uncharacterized protein YodC (DUF2158 family)